MGWWSLDLTTGGHTLDFNPMWGDSMADVIDAKLNEILPALFKECNEHFLESDAARNMDPREFLCGLAFSLSGIETIGPLEELLGKDLPFTLNVSVGEIV